MQSYQNYQNVSLSIHLTDVGRGQGVSGDESITINVPVVYMARYFEAVQYPLRGALEIETFLGPEIARSEVVLMGYSGAGEH